VPVFEDLSLVLDCSWKTALIGRNGRGKSTLLGLIRGELQPRSGELRGPVRVQGFPFDTGDTTRPTRQLIREGVAPFEHWEREMERLTAASDEASLARYGEILEVFEGAGGYDIEARIETEFAELEMDPGLLDRRFDTLSGGERTRALITVLFLQRDSYPLIDEPTNHLDIEGRARLGKYLAGKSGFLLVSHDREVLDLCADHVLSLERDGARLIQGNHATWQQQTERRHEEERRRHERLGKELKSLERSARKRRSWAGAKEREKQGADDKGFVSHRAAKQMKRALAIERRGREKTEEKRELLRGVEKERRLKLSVDDQGPETLIAASDLSLRMGDKLLCEGLSFTLRRGERLALLGPNGSGKSSLLRAICGELEPSGGALHLPARLRLTRAYQDPLWTRGLLREQLTTAEIDETRFRQILAALGVSGEIFDRPLETFSQGERKKVDLSRSFLDPAQLLIWDEPLNYIDLISREQIEELVLAEAPTMIFVEHDRRFVDRVATARLDLGRRPNNRGEMP
jgi:lincosamide and streptogramin A transport system ATP-binding/permease protein